MTKTEEPSFDSLRRAFQRERAGQGPGGAGKALRQLLRVDQEACIKREVRGDLIAVRRSRIVDRAISIFVRATLDKSDLPLAVFATGGFGRGLLAPFSDVDLLFVHEEAAPDRVKPVVDQILYPLWDAGLALGHGVHTSRSAIDLAKSDLSALTSYLDARLLAGSPGAAADFLDAYDVHRLKTAARFTRAKIAERRERLRVQLQTGSWIEPNLKEGRGGLRDLDTIGWLYKYTSGADLWSRRPPAEFIDGDDYRTLIKARRLLWSVRTYLHLTHGRADENVQFDVQPALAAQLGYGDREHISAPERLLKHLRLTRDTVDRLARIVAARMEARYARLNQLTPRPTPQALLTDEARGKVNVRIRMGRVDFASAATARRKPRDLFRLVRAASKRPNLEIHPDALELLYTGATQLPRDIREDDQTKAVFLGILEETKDPFRTFRVLSDTGLLAKYIPFFGKLAGRIEYGLYRRYSIEDSIFRSLGVLVRIRRGELKQLHPISASLLRQRPLRTQIYLAVLLQEVGWAVNDDDPVKVERLAFRVAKRFVEPEEAKDVAWCAAHPELLIRTAEQRNLSRALSIKQFGDEVQTVSRLQILLVLTVCRMRTISDDSWDEWTRRQIGALYFGARAYLEGGASGLADWRQDERRRLEHDLNDFLPDWSSSKITERVDALAGGVGARLPPEALARGLQMAEAASRRTRLPSHSGTVRAS